MKSIAKKILKSDIRAAAELMNLIESDDLVAIKELKILQEHTGGSHVIGITGLPGSGKSTIINALIRKYREKSKSVGVIAVDPSSPFSGGSLMGDRIRMKNHSPDREVFIKSLPTRGWHGGVSKATSRMITVMDAMGKDVILVETAGVGQAEVDIKKMVHTAIVVLVGGLSDHIQIMKAGIMEIADIFVINKAESNKNTQDVELDLKTFFTSDGDGGKIWSPPIFLTEAIDDTGIDSLVCGIENHLGYLKKEGRYEKYFEDKKNYDLKQMIKDYIMEEVKNRIKDEKIYKKVLERFLAASDGDKPVMDKILKDFFK